MQENISQNFTRRLTALKAATGLKWEDLAVQLGVSREHLYNYRVGKHSPPPHIDVRLEAAEREAGIVGEPALGAAVAGRGEMGGDYFSGLSPESRKIAEAITAALGEEMRAMEERLRTTLLDSLGKEIGKGKRGR